MTNVIYYFTGTGNSLKIAKDINEKLKSFDFNIVSISKNIENVQSFRPDGIVGFIFPVYYCGIPKIVIEFMEKINLSNALYTFVVAAYASTGGNGGCLHQAKNILLKHNTKLNSGFYIKTVDNFILWTWDVPSLEKQERIHKSIDGKIDFISKYILEKSNFFDKSFVEYIGPIIFRYKHFIANVNTADKAFTASTQCTSCGICSKICPTYNVSVDVGKPKWKSENCQKCLACLHLCPNKAVNYGKITMKRQRYKNPFIKVEELFN